MKERLTGGQVGALVFAALLAPMILTVPGAAPAGRGTWLACVAALPGGAALGWSFGVLRGAGGMRAALGRVFGRQAGTVLTGGYLLWALLLLGWNARRSAWRFLGASYSNGPLPLFLLLLVGAAVWAGRRGPGVPVRAGCVFALALAVGLGCALALGLGQLETAYLGPISWEELRGIPAGTLPVLGLLGYGVFGTFLPGTGPEPGQGARWAAGVCLLAGLLSLVCVGSFGPGLVRQMTCPFFMVVRGIGVQGAFQRVESLVVALWVLADLALLGLLLASAREMAESWVGGERGEKLTPLLGVIGAGLGLWSGWDGPWPVEQLALWGNLLLGGGLPVVTALLVVKRTGKEGNERGCGKCEKTENSC